MKFRVLLSVVLFFHAAVRADSLAVIDKAIERKDWKQVAVVAAAEAAKNPKDKTWPQFVALAMANMRMDQLERPIRLRQTASQLPREGQDLLKDLGQRLGKWVALENPDARSTEGAGLLSAVKQLAQAYPDLPRAWIMEAELALALNRSIEGRIAARNLEELRTWETTSTDVLLLLGQLQTRGWMPALNADDTQRQRLSQFSDALGRLGKETMQEKLPAVLGEVKAFCGQNENLPNGWLLQMNLASILGRSLDKGIAQKRLVALKPSKSTP